MAGHDFDGPACSRCGCFKDAVERANYFQGLFARGVLSRKALERDIDRCAVGLDCDESVVRGVMDS